MSLKAAENMAVAKLARFRVRSETHLPLMQFEIGQSYLRGKCEGMVEWDLPVGKGYKERAFGLGIMCEQACWSTVA